MIFFDGGQTGRVGTHLNFTSRVYNVRRLLNEREKKDNLIILLFSVWMFYSLNEKRGAIAEFKLE